MVPFGTNRRALDCEERRVVLDQWLPSGVSPAGCAFSVGWAGGGVAGAVGSLLGCMSMTVDEKFRCFAKIARLKEVTMKMAATTTVSLLKKLAGPRLPNTV